MEEKFTLTCMNQAMAQRMGGETNHKQSYVSIGPDNSENLYNPLQYTGTKNFSNYVNRFDTKSVTLHANVNHIQKYGEFALSAGRYNLYTSSCSTHASPAFASTITGTLGGSVGGYTGGLAAGLLATGDFSEANDMALEGALSGGIIGAATGFAGGIKYARDHKISPWTGEKTQNHHSFPKFLGGDDKQILTPMETSRHRTLHKELNEYLKTQTSDDKRYNMFPRKGNSGDTIRNNFTDATRINAAKTFYDSNKWRYWDARFDFYRNNKMIWTPW